MPETPGLFTPIRVGPLTLPNRIVMAPLTRCRAPGNLPGPVNATYYAQRASAGLIISEATQVSVEGRPNDLTPGIHSAGQVEGWKAVTQAVHARGGRIFLQLWHVGRAKLAEPQAGGGPPVAPSAVANTGGAMTAEGHKPYPTPRALELAEIPGIVESYRLGASHAKDAGFDGVEVHGANGYLIDQFLRDGTNRRTDAYGGPVANRARFLFQVLAAVSSVWGADRVGLRLSPSSTFNDMRDSDPRATFGHVVEHLNPLGLAYLHMLEPTEADQGHGGTLVPVSTFRPLYRGVLMANSGFTRATADAAIRSGECDLISFGKLFIANPDLPERFRLDAPLNPPDPSTFYGGNEHGYVDYPAMTT